LNDLDVDGRVIMKLILKT